MAGPDPVVVWLIVLITHLDALLLGFIVGRLVERHRRAARSTRNTPEPPSTTAVDATKGNP